MPLHALIGHTGFVGSNLLRQRDFSALYNSKNIAEIDDKAFDHVVCAGVQAQKWWANKNPEEDWAGIARLIDRLKTIKARTFTLISTVDVFATPIGAYEDDADLNAPGLHAYGKNRLRLEAWVRETFPKAHIVRLPALFGPNLKKNILFDLLHDNQIENIVPNARFQWYPLTRLGRDLQIVQDEGIELVQLVSEPVVTEDIRARFFPETVIGQNAPNPPAYDLKTHHAERLGGAGGYIMPAGQVVDDLKAWIDAERAGQ